MSQSKHSPICPSPASPVCWPRCPPVHWAGNLPSFPALSLLLVSYQLQNPIFQANCDPRFAIFSQNSHPSRPWPTLCWSGRPALWGQAPHWANSWLAAPYPGWVCFLRHAERAHTGSLQSSWVFRGNSSPCLHVHSLLTLQESWELPTRFSLTPSPAAAKLEVKSPPDCCITLCICFKDLSLVTAYLPVRLSGHTLLEGKAHVWCFFFFTPSCV